MYSDSAEALASSLRLEEDTTTAQVLASIIYENPHTATAAAQAKGKLSSAWLLLVLVAGVAALASAAAGVFLVLALRGQEAIDPYFDQVADRQEQLVGKSEPMFSEITADFEACARSLYSVAACDRAFAKLGEWGDAVAATRDSIQQLSPPPAAATWHADYLQFLSDSSAWTDRIVAAWQSGDRQTLENEFNKLDSFIQREDNLAQRFEEIQKQLGAY